MKITTAFLVVMSLIVFIYRPIEVEAANIIVTKTAVVDSYFYSSTLANPSFNKGNFVKGSSIEVYATPVRSYYDFKTMFYKTTFDCYVLASDLGEPGVNTDFSYYVKDTTFNQPFLEKCRTNMDSTQYLDFHLEATNFKDGKQYLCWSDLPGKYPYEKAIYAFQDLGMDVLFTNNQFKAKRVGDGTYYYMNEVSCKNGVPAAYQKVVQSVEIHNNKSFDSVVAIRGAICTSKRNSTSRGEILFRNQVDVLGFVDGKLNVLSIGAYTGDHYYSNGLTHNSTGFTTFTWGNYAAECFFEEYRPSIMAQK